MAKFVLIFVLNIISAFIVGILNDKNIKSILKKATFYALYFNAAFAIVYKYTKYVRKEVFVIPMWIVWTVGIVCGIIFFSKIKLFKIIESFDGGKWNIVDHVIFILVEMLLVSTQKRDYEYLKVYLACIMTVAIYACIIVAYKVGVNNQKRKAVLSDVALLFCVGAAGEYLNSIVYQSDVYIPAMFVDFLVLTFLFFLTLNVNFSIALYFVINMIWVLAHYFVSEFRGPLVPTDIFAFGTAMDVASQYSLYTNKEIWILLVATLLIVMVCIYGKKARLLESVFINNCVRAIGSIIVILISLTLFNCDFIEKYNLYWEQFGVGTIANTYHKVGPTLGFIEVLKKTQVDKPEGYSKKQVNKLAERYVSTKNCNGVKPNIIVIMNETFADIGDLGNLNRSSDTYLKNYNSLTADGKRIAKGRTLVSTFGGDTAKSEYEFLTGNSLAMEPGVNPYLTEINYSLNSIVTTLQDQGYYTVATHPCHETNWNRNKVYRYLNFDEMLFLNDYDNPETIRNWVVDNEVYDKIDELLKKNDTDKPLFVFGVTVQNHGGYSVDTLSDSEKYLGDNELDLYLNLVSISDKALGKLLNQIDSYEEPTILLFFGDHYPRLSENIFENITDVNKFGDMELSQTKNMTPYLVYANYDVDLSVFDSVTSLNYLGTDLLGSIGLELTPYNNMSLEMQSYIPAINAYGYMNSEGEYLSFADMTDDEKIKLNDYFILEYDLIYGSHDGEAFTIK
ncbi:LTA synthase family protein [Butyrivibrio proteoclasticus]|uniref:LTA synthase family protein n=1 Tax=Butyrivibrio proteoclasticus TaxID=43305 RepID=UPI0004794342|nr:LTA synthase family protein [Butyrivibrio proteoclasticus]